MILMKDGIFLTIKVKKFKNEIILRLSLDLKNKIIQNYSKFRKIRNDINKSVVILYQEEDFFNKKFKVKEIIDDFNFLLEKLSHRNYSIYFKLHPHWNRSFDKYPILQKYQDFKFTVLHSSEPIEYINFTPDFFIGNMSSAFKFLNPKKNNLIFTYEEYCPILNYSLNYKLGMKYLKSNEKNVFSESIRVLSTYL